MSMIPTRLASSREMRLHPVTATLYRNCHSHSKCLAMVEPARSGRAILASGLKFVSSLSVIRRVGGLSAPSKHSGLVSRAGPCAPLALQRDIATHQRLRRRLDVSITLLACARATDALKA
jgi:hypothetical protein